MKATYLIINFFSVLFPILLSFDKRVRFYRNWKYIFPGLIITALVFLVWDYIFTANNVWSFNPRYILGWNLWGLPFEEILFFFTVPFACLFIYECLNHYIKKDLLKSVSRPVSLFLTVLSAIILLLFYQRIYTLITFSLLLILLIYAQHIAKSKIMGRFYLAYLISLLPFFIVNGILTSVPVVMYNDSQNLGFRIGTIPVEDFFYSFSLLLMNTLFFEYFRRREKNG